MQKKQRILRGISVLAVLIALLYLVHRIDSNRETSSLLDLKAESFSAPIIKERNSSIHRDSSSALATFESLSRLKGKISVINFWASWCEACSSERTYLENLHDSFGDSVQFIGIASNDTLAAIVKSGKAKQISYQLLLDETGKIARKFRVSALPNTFLVDGSGRIVKSVFSAMNPKVEADLAEKIKELTE